MDNLASDVKKSDDKMAVELLELVLSKYGMHLVTSDSGEMEFAGELGKTGSVEASTLCEECNTVLMASSHYRVVNVRFDMVRDNVYFYKFTLVSEEEQKEVEKV